MSQLIQQSEATAGQKGWYFACVDDTDGKTPETGLTFSSGELQISKAGAAFANFAGASTELSDGLYWYEATTGEVGTLGPIGFKVEKTGVRLVLMQPAQVVPWDPYAAADLGLTNLNATISSRASQTSLDTLDDYVDTEVAAIKAKTDNLPADPADASDIAALFATVNTKLDTIDDFIDTEVAAIKAKTDNLPADPADASDIAAAVAAIQSDTNDIQTRLPAALVGGLMDSSVGSLGTDAISAASVSAAAVTKIAAGVGALIVEGSDTLLDTLRGHTSLAGGPALDFTTGTIEFKSIDGTVTRWIGVADATGLTGRISLTRVDLITP